MGTRASASSLKAHYFELAGNQHLRANQVVLDVLQEDGVFMLIPAKANSSRSEATLALWLCKRSSRSRKTRPER